MNQICIRRKRDINLLYLQPTSKIKAFIRNNFVVTSNKYVSTRTLIGNTTVSIQTNKEQNDGDNLYYNVYRYKIVSSPDRSYMELFSETRVFGAEAWLRAQSFWAFLWAWWLTFSVRATTTLPSSSRSRSVHIIGCILHFAHQLIYLFW